MLSARRRELVRLEDTSGKKIDVRVSDTIAVDRVNFHAYDERNADIDVEKLPRTKPPTIKQLQEIEANPPASVEAVETTTTKRRRRRGKTAPADALTIALATAAEADDVIDAEVDGEQSAETQTKKKRRRRSRRGRRDAQETPAADAQATEAAGQVEQVEAVEAVEPVEPVEAVERIEATEPVEPVMDEKTKPASRLGPIRIHKLAREMGVASREVIRLCLEACGAKVKNHMSSISQDKAETIRQAVVPPPDTADRAVDRTEDKIGDTTPTKPDVVIEAQPDGEATQDTDADKPVEEKRRRRRGGRRRGGRGRGRRNAAQSDTQSETQTDTQDPVQPRSRPQPQSQAGASDTAPMATDDGERNADQDGERPTGRKKRSRRRRRSTPAQAADSATQTVDSPTQAADSPTRTADTSPAPKPAEKVAPVTTPVNNGDGKETTIPRPKRRIGLYGRGRRAISPKIGAQNAANDDR